MFKWKEINNRFMSFSSSKTQYEIAEYYQISQPTVSKWVAGKQQVPWRILKELVDSKQISWNWLLEGRGSKLRRQNGNSGNLGIGVFDTPAINQRFLSLFEGMTQKEIADFLDVSQPAISGWKIFDRQVPWKKLKLMVDARNISWDWLLEGITPWLLSP